MIDKEDKKYFDWCPKKVRTLLTCYESLCDKERYEDILSATLIFFVTKHRECADKNFTLEQHAQDMKDNFIRINKEMDKKRNVKKK